MKNQIITLVSEKRLKDGLYEFGGRLPDSRSVRLSVVVSGSCYESSIDYYDSNVDFELWDVDNQYQLTDEEVLFWSGDEFYSWVEKCLNGGFINE